MGVVGGEKDGARLLAASKGRKSFADKVFSRRGATFCENRPWAKVWKY